MRTGSILTVAAAMTAAIAACTSYDPNLGATPFFCGTVEPKCPDGYTCLPAAGGGSAVCATMEGSGSGSGSGSGTCTMAHVGELAKWDFTGATGSQASTAGMSSTPGVTAGSISRAPALMASSGTNSISASGWATGAQPDMTKYYTLSLTPPSGCTLTLGSVAIDVTASGTGPTSAAVATSADAFAQTAAVSTSAPSSPTLSVVGHSGSVEVRIYGYGASATSGTMRVQNTLTVSGALQ